MTTPTEVAVGTIPTLVGTVPAGGQIYMRVEGTQPVTVSNAANASSNLVVGGGTVLAAPTAPGNGGSTTQVYAPSTGGADTTEWYAIAPAASVLLVEVSAVPSGGGLTDVTTFGTVGNGIADDTAALQEAINSGKSLFLSAGTYKITSPLSLPNGLTMIGAGPGQIYSTTSSNAVIVPYGCNAFTVQTGNTAGLLSNFQIDGSHAASYTAIDFPDATQFYQAEWLLTYLLVQNFTSGQGAYFGNDLGGLYVDHCSFYNNGSGMYITGSDAVVDGSLFVVNVNGIVCYGAVTTIVNNSFGTNSLDAIVLPAGGSSGGCMIAHNGINQNGQHGIAVLGTGGHKIIGNTIRGNSTSGTGTYSDILIANTDDRPCVVDDNTFEPAGTTVASYSVEFSGTGLAVVGSGNAVVPGANSLGFTNAPAQAMTSPSQVIVPIGNLQSGSAGSGTTTETLSVTTNKAGDVLVLFATSYPSQPVSSVSGGGVTTWTHGVYNSGTGGIDYWWGLVTTAGQATVTVSYATAPNGGQFVVQELHSLSGSITADGSPVSGSDTSVVFGLPVLAPAADYEAYVAYCAMSAKLSVPAGYVVQATTATGIGINGYLVTNCSATTVNAGGPVVQQSLASGVGVVAALLG